MILFLSFVPIQYMGGAERKIYELYLNANKKEQSFIINVSPSISNLYGQAVLKQKFDDRSKGKLNLNKKNSMQLRIMHFIPFTKDWHETKNKINDARVIYAKSELMEFMILLYFGGIKVLNKVIAGVRSPLIYPTPINNWERFHNIVYKSSLLKIILKRTKIVHVLNERDKKFFSEEFNLKNIELIPNYTTIPELNSLKRVIRAKNELRIIFVGELLSRKGIEMLIKIIKQSPKEYKFDIVGDGPSRNKIIHLTKIYPYSKYHGYLDKAGVTNLMNHNDILFFPSFAEGFGNVIIEAMALGLKVVDSTNVSLNLPHDIEYSVKVDDEKGYMKVFKKLYRAKKSNIQNRAKIRNYCSRFYKTNVIMPKLMHRLFDLKIGLKNTYHTL